MKKKKGMRLKSANSSMLCNLNIMVHPALKVETIVTIMMIALMEEDHLLGRELRDAQGPQPRPPQPRNHNEDEDDARPPPRSNDRNEEEIFGKLKFTMPKFQGEEDPDAYLSWVLKVDKIFRIHNFSEAKKVAMASLEFEGYANVWWEEVNKKRAKEELEPIGTWEEMQQVMHKRFVPNHHKRDLFNKLTQLKQSFKSVEEYYKEMQMTMMSANVDEREEQTMARFLNGLNIPVKRIVEFLPYTNMVELLHQATRAERQVREDIASAKTKSFFAARNATTTSSSIKNTSAIAPKDPPKQMKSAFKTTSFKPDQSTMSSKASTGSSNITCFKNSTMSSPTSFLTDYHRFEASNTALTSYPALPYQTAPPTAPTPKTQRRSNAKYKASSKKGMFAKA
ncbi:hypothetical protein QYE76_059994 [Lolium multiflorum]|uniref:Retrotransposon gag domain-containing protein n=1 Tax=Lolium multiflorum TaxID=4521 RepID=A0AAD8RYZ9_LOLMU|nr:hypothetical protein QYE76_059994 [Lolium multiflorum]